MFFILLLLSRVMGVLLGRGWWVLGWWLWVGGGRPSLESAFIRNISKVYWVLLILDVVGGFFTVGDPRQKYSDRIARTTVV
jgi:hypothetical protein